MVCHRSEWQAPSEPPSDCLAWLSTSVLISKYPEHSGSKAAMFTALHTRTSSHLDRAWTYAAGWITVLQIECTKSSGSEFRVVLCCILKLYSDTVSGLRHHKLHSMNSTQRKNFRNSAGFRLLKAPVTQWLHDTLGWEQAESADIVDVVAYLEQRRAGADPEGWVVPASAMPYLSLSVLLDTEEEHGGEAAAIHQQLLSAFAEYGWDEEMVTRFRPVFILQTVFFQ